ncbi:LysR family transcriptional regulator [Macrococcoides canis]|uniref:LysR family transcriptional regulator n=1 Tax=Macrococcoides canis TaxID=1855823 RepID=UPI0020B6BA75|nr:LysR family transcriptional regulator [Macrococcus canis]UTG99811.1 LysR family transcriptional regulator [Macrococcus canis]WBF53200.1 LysR family transcriptional regulator [Macrococcus canis]
MELRQLITFKTIAETGSFTKTSEKLGYAQSSITTHILNLEEELGFSLFDRLGKNIILNHNGERILSHADKIIKEIELIKAHQISPEEITGTLKIGAPEAILSYRLPSILKKYKSLYPKIKIDLKHISPNDIFQELSQGHLDIAFIICDEPQIKDIQSIKFCDEELKLISNRSMDISNIETLLEANNIIFTEIGCYYRSAFERILNQYSIMPSETMTLDNIESIKQCVINDLGISVLPLIAIQNEINNKQLYSFTLPSKISSHILYHKNKTMTPAIQAFIKILTS